MIKVIKRDGSLQPFDFNKVTNAARKAFESVGQSIPDKFIDRLKNIFDKMQAHQNKEGIEENLEVEQIQDIIQNELIKNNKYEVVESFIRYRQKREEYREKHSKLIKDIKKALQASDVQNQNANLDEESFGGRIGSAASIVAKNDALRNCMSSMARRNHENNMIYQHDLDSYSVGLHNCLSVPFDDLLAHGFSTRQTDVRPANSINTALQLVAVIFQIQSLQQFGGVSATHLDWTLVPYVRKSFFKHYNDIRNTLSLKPVHYDKDKIKDLSIDDAFYKGGRFSILKHYVYKKAIERTKKELHQAVEGMYHNLNTLQSRSGNQLPFSSINYGTCTLPEGRMVIDSILDVSIEGLGQYHITSIFPCGIFQYKKGVNDRQGTPNYDLYRKALKSTALRIYPNYANCDWSSQQSWVEQDRDDKQEYIDSLSQEDKDKLASILEQHPDIAQKMGLSVEDGQRTTA